MITGRKGSIGPALPRPRSSLPQPHWKTATTTPKAPATAMTFMAAALSGMPIERKASRSSRQPRATTTPTKSGSLPTMISAKSSYEAVTPPTFTSREVPASALGSTFWRSRSTSSLVAFDCGEESGTTVRTAVSPEPLYVTGETAATPLVAESAAGSRPRATRSSAPSSPATRVRGPLTPGPKPSASRS